MSGYKQKSGNGLLKTFFNKGNRGEYFTYRKACKLFPKDNIFTNVYLENINTTDTEIDVMAVDASGIYVFEVKNYGGYIFGSDKDETWTQVMNKRTKNKFYSPIRQNFAHEKALERYLNVNDSKIHPMVVFNNRAKLEKEFQTNIVITLSNLSKTVRSTKKVSQCHLSDNEISSYKNALSKKILASRATKKQHVQEVKDLQERNGR